MGAEKPRADFARDRCSTDGLQHRCRTCARMMRQESIAKRSDTQASVFSKTCSRCGIEKPLHDFAKHDLGLHGRRACCKVCTAMSRDVTASRACRYRSKYGMTLGDYERMLSNQNYGCAVCGSTDSRSKTGLFVVDHDHETGEVRALLCNKCNPAIGLMDDEPERLEAAARYLRAFGRN